MKTDPEGARSDLLNICVDLWPKRPLAVGSDECETGCSDNRFYLSAFVSGFWASARRARPSAGLSSACRVAGSAEADPLALPGSPLGTPAVNLRMNSSI